MPPNITTQENLQYQGLLQTLIWYMLLVLSVLKPCTPMLIIFVFHTTVCFVSNDQDFAMVYNSYMPYIVNNIPVGHDPEEITRVKSYNDFFEQVGNSASNIILVKNFLSDEEIKYLFDNMHEKNKMSFESQKDENGNAVNWMHIYTGIHDKFGIRHRIAKTIVRAYKFNRIKPKEPQLSVAKWETGTKLNLHVDDLGYVTDNHIPTLVYLNDDYEGGEISFATHDLVIKPKVGDLLIFPGNMHYAHEVKEVLSGTRYTLPIWFTIV